MKWLVLNLVYGVYAGYACEMEGVEYEVSDALYKKLQKFCGDDDCVSLEDVLDDFECDNECKLTAKQSDEVKKLCALIREEIIENDESYLYEDEETINWNNLIVRSIMVFPDKDEE